MSPLCGASNQGPEEIIWTGSLEDEQRPGKDLQTNRQKKSHHTEGWLSHREEMRAASCRGRKEEGGHERGRTEDRNSTYRTVARPRLRGRKSKEEAGDKEAEEKSL